MSPVHASGLLWLGWVVSWFLAAAWSRRATARPPPLARVIDLGLTALGAILLVRAARLELGAHALSLGEPRLWRLPGAVGWTVFVLEAFGFAFTWWARLTLGDLWSGAVSRKEKHVVVERGPYGLVRHPIYTGMIVAAVALAILLGYASALLGAALMALGFAVKARLEERFLAAELGEGAYGDYRRRTPMLIPFWPVSG